MIAEEKKQQLLTVIAQLEDEAAFDKIEAMVQDVLHPQRQRGKAGFLRGSVSYMVDNWDAPLTDWKHQHE
ncbi:hypothetical protein QMK33_07445 [Hymenobacter sp. H14-R3]|uniref:hypothetical protein n=1 Tax=Hymenobacter sp. H14-R3 TaxID=3046308 RepID=UPI0024BB7729|nr:hypothetical protein [Hymenobacter sp. H14-R3]MDJ0364983.1 hypothetical protein [Hymenobacter sp. H14-R3]